ncbi:DMT family transporter [Inquilinus limosus]|uniref:DMT family transporter n=1 Tax=Inquilinus limosus TaxID=171674 RepID=UPI000406DCE8|nr:DMT family transporter [Inquilinus limosus]
MSTSRPQIQGILIYALGIGAFATMDALAKHLSRDYPVFELVLLRVIVGYLPILIQYQLGPEQGWQAVRSQTPGLQLLRGGLMLASAATFLLSLSRLTLADATALSLIAPLLMAVFGVYVLREPSSRQLSLTIAVAIAGALLIVHPYLADLSVYVLVACLSAIFYALAAVTTRKLGQSDPSIVTALWGNTTMLAGAAALVGLTGWTWPVEGDWLPVLGMGLAGGLANILYIVGLRRSRVSDVAVMDYTSFAWAAAFGILVFREPVSAASLLGAGLIVGSGAYSAFHKWRRSGAGASSKLAARPRGRSLQPSAQ